MDISDEGWEVLKEGYKRRFGKEMSKEDQDSVAFGYAFRDVERERTELTTEEEKIFNAIVSARKIQRFLWGEHNKQCGVEEFARMLRKRVFKIDEISTDNPHWKVEMKKRLLQTSAVAINLMQQIDEREISLESNLPEFSEKLKKDK